MNEHPVNVNSLRILIWSFNSLSSNILDESVCSLREFFMNSNHEAYCYDYHVTKLL